MINLTKRMLLFFLAFLFIQYSTIFAIPENPEYEMNNFVWSISTALSNRQEEIIVPEHFKMYPDKIINAIDIAFDNVPYGEIAVKGIYVSTEKIKFTYIKNAPIFTLTSLEDLKEIKTYTSRLGMTEYLLAFNTQIKIDDLKLFLGADPINVYSNEKLQISTYNKNSISDSMRTNLVWNYPTVYHIEIVEPNQYLVNLTIDKYVAKETARINPGMKIRDKVRAVNDILVSNYSYDLNSTSVKKHYPTALIEDKKGVCSAYAMLAFKMLDALNVPCLLVEGMSTDQTGQFQEHMWVLVKDENNLWYHFDPTFNDPIPDKKGRVLEDYLWLNDQQLSKDHTWIYTDYSFDKNNNTYQQLKKMYNPQVVLQINSPYVYINSISTLLDNSNMNVTPILIGDSTYIPVRTLAEIYGASVEWDGTRNRVTIYYKNKTIVLTIDDNNIMHNNKQRTISNKPVIYEGRTLLPLRDVMELLGKQVDWKDETKQITIH